MKKLTFLAASAALLLAACSEPLQEAAEINPLIEPEISETPITFSPEEYRLIEQMVNKTPKVSSEDAQQAAMALFGQDGMSTLVPIRLTAKVFCNQKKIPGGLNKSAKIENDTAFYLFNAPDGNGFAIISADIRVPQQVLAYSDNGSFDFDADNEATELFLDLAKEYVAECIETAEMQKDSLTESIYNKLGIPDDTKGLRTKKYHERILLTNLSTKKRDFRTTAEIKPMIKTEWDQEYPFNIQAPDGYPAGCVTIATAQLMKYWRYPSYIGNKVLIWSKIDDNVNDYSDLTFLLKHISSGIDVKYKTNNKGQKVGRTTLHKALKYLKSLNYSVPNQLYDYKYEKVINSLNNGYPVLMKGKQEKNMGGLWYSEGHDWLVDGYVEQRETISATLTYIVIDVDDNNNTSTHYEYEPQNITRYYNYLHINWGWGKGKNGYYCKDVFYVRDRYLPNSDGTYGIQYLKSEYNYRYDLEIATDIRPKR